jgi:hypothetical protein
MLKLVERALLTSTMGFAWDLIKAGERIVAYSESWGADEAYDLRAPFAERWIHNRGMSIIAMSERLELSVNWLAMKLGYEDGEVSRMVASPTLAH